METRFHQNLKSTKRHMQPHFQFSNEPLKFLVDGVRLLYFFFFGAVWSGSAISDAPLHHPLPRSRGCLLTASLVVCSVSSLLPSSLSLCPLPGTAYRPPRCPHSCSALLTGDHRPKPGRITDTRCLCVWCFAGTPSAQEMLSAFFPPSCSVAQSRALRPNPVTIPEHSSLIPTTACYRFPQTMRLCYNFSLAGGASIKLWTSKAVYGRTENFKLYNRQLPCPLTPPPLHSICGQSVGGFGWEQIKNSQTHSRQELREKWNTHCINDISIVVCCLRILNCFFRSRLPQENPPSEWRKKSWWAAHKHHGCYVNTHVNMYINPCHPMCTHQAAIRASIKGGNLQQSRAPPASALRVSFVFWPVVSAPARIIDVSACTRQTGRDAPAPGGVQACRVGPQTGSHWLCGAGPSQKGHRRAGPSKDVFTRVGPRFTVFILPVSLLQQRLYLLILEINSFTVLVASSWF